MKTRVRRYKPKMKPTNPHDADFYVTRKNKYLNTIELSEQDRRLHEHNVLSEFKEVKLQHLEHLISNEDYIDALPGCSYTEEDVIALQKAIAQLTPKQQRIVQGYLSGEKQIETAKAMGITQGTISMAWTGCKNYRGGKPDVYVGGILKKLKAVLNRDKEYVDILKKCGVCKEEKEAREFCRDRSRKDGLNYKCRKCDGIR